MIKVLTLKHDGDKKLCYTAKTGYDVTDRLKLTESL